MGLLDKVKGILFDEEEVEIPEIKKEPKIAPKKEIVIENIEETNPIKEIKVPKDDFSDKENYKNETTFTFPIDFEDEEPLIMERPKQNYIERKPEQKKDIRDYSSFLNKKEEKKKFKPTPIISPVYGVLDQNYKKEDVVVKTDILRSPKELTIEEVRKRAFGTLEDDLERNLADVEKEKIVIETVIEKEDKVIKLKKELEKKKERKVEEPVDKLKTIGELMEENEVEVDIPEINSIIKDDTEYNINTDEEVISERPKNSIDDLLSKEEEFNTEKEEFIEEKIIEDEDEIDDDEADLFSLIDSMYEDKGE